MKQFLAGAAAIVLLLAGSARSQPKFAWDPVTPKDWEVTQDSEKNIRHAVMIFEKVFADETGLKGEDCKLRTYRRIRIFDTEGKKEADVSVKYDPDNQKVRAIGGRTILPDGTTKELRPESILEKDVVKTEEEKLKQKFFTLPAVTDSCIIEYYYDEESKDRNPSWAVQKDIAMKAGEYHWKFFIPEVTSYEDLMMRLFSLGFSPSYFMVNCRPEPAVEMLPDARRPTEAIFRVQDRVPFNPEPFALAPAAARPKVLFYYTSNAGLDYYWTAVSTMAGKTLDKFESDNGKSKKVVGEIAKLPTPAARINAAHDWLQQNIRNVSYAREEVPLKENDNVDDVFERKYGTLRDINYTFHSMLTDLGVKSRVMYVTNRHEHLFYETARFWQFDSPIVAVIDSGGGVTFYSPGDAGTVPGRVPYYFEGSQGLVVGAKEAERLFHEVPKSASTSNTSTTRLAMDIGPGAEASCEVTGEYTGQDARALRRMLYGKPEPGQRSALKEQLAGELSNDWSDSINIEQIASKGDTLVTKYLIHGPSIEADPAGKIVLMPYAFFAQVKSPFVGEKREDPIMFDYAKISARIFTFKLDPGVSVKTLPSPVSFVSSVGTVSATASLAGDTLMFVTRFEVKAPFYSPNMYDKVKALFQQNAGLQDIAIVLGKK
jgi:hypothetical protein